jgi:hypothetical protein
LPATTPEAPETPLRTLASANPEPLALENEPNA